MFEALCWRLSALLIYLGELTLLLRAAMRYLLRGQFAASGAVEQMAQVGVNSLPIVLITVGCAGMVLSLYTAEEMLRHGADYFVGWMVAFTVVRELGPVITAVMAASRVGSAFAAEIGTMTVTEQVDALRALATSPIAYLVTPRLLACIVMLPVLGTFADMAGVLGGYVVAGVVGLRPSVYLDSIRNMLETSDVIVGLVKTIPFGIIIAIVSCRQGLKTHGGAMGVGRATTEAVVLSLVFIYVADVILSSVLPK